MREGIKQIGKSRIYDICTSMNKGYIYDMPVVRYTTPSYMTASKTPLILNISDKPINEW